MPRMRALSLALLLANAAQQSAAQCVVTIAGPISVEGSPATTQTLSGVFGIATDGAQGYYIADNGANRITRLFPNGSMVTAMGFNRNSGGSAGDGLPGTQATVNGVSLIAPDGAGGIYLADKNNNLVRRLLSNGTVMRVAGNLTAGWTGDGGTATLATLRGPVGVAWDNVTAGGGLWISDTNK